MANEPTDPEELKNAIRRQELEHLSGLDGDLTIDPEESLGYWYRASYNDLVRWTKENERRIGDAVFHGMWGGPPGSPINWKCALVAFLESAAMYLRDTSMVLKAVELYRSKDTKVALETLARATHEIDLLARSWGMEYIVVCDFVSKHPDGHRYIVGPYCGAFYHIGGNVTNPFVGFAFKGTSVINEFWNDLDVKTEQTAPGILHQTHVASGFFDPIFSKYGSSETNIPYVMLREAFQYVTQSAQQGVMVHCTGHSLGGAYSSLTYGQLIIDGWQLPKFVLGDLYTFGSPRTGLNDFARAFRDSQQPGYAYGSSWRIANEWDVITKVPFSFPGSANPFTHVDKGYRISSTQDPVKLHSEITGTTWPQTPQHWWDPFRWHYTEAYYASLYHTATKIRARLSATFTGLQFLEVTSALGGAAGYRQHLERVAIPAQQLSSFPNTSAGEIILESNNMCTTGIVRVGAYAAELFAWGDASALDPVSASLYYRSMEQLTAAGITFIVSATGPQELQLVFAAGDVITAVLVVPTRGSVENTHISGRCIWIHEPSTADVEQADKTEDAPLWDDASFNKYITEVMSQRKDDEPESADIKW